ncbi:thiol reductase thioredoxin [Bacillus sp. MUM 116]|uniref:thioredoxin family protein n=1 Tax=Bacillus sp. MUM 116 TaxID=1678002 RepID=UPI0008F5899D|nr:thioredoxin family protein [Bacillus sp. MUM 116]OIK08905.1 thiol reductase thioredoxin [Bacillus sp. MUM 116]
MFKQLHSETFDKEIEKGITLIEFGAKWCPPCRIQEPILEEISEEYKEKLVIAKVDVDQEPGLAAKFDIQGVPTMLLFKDGQKVDSLRGLHYIDDIRTKLETKI